MRVRGVELAGNWTPEETAEAEKILTPLPAEWLEANPHFRILVRQPVLRDAPPSAPGHSKYEPSVGAIVVYDKGVYDGERIDPEQFRRSVFHELAHTIVRKDPRLLAAWTASTSGDGFVDEYARSHPEEDLADTFSEYLLHRDDTAKAVPSKAEFIRCMLEGQEKTAMNFMRGFSDELTKCAAGGMGRMARAMRFGKKTAPGAGHAGLGLGKALALAGVGAAGAGAIGAKAGKEKGYESGTSDVMDVAQRARMLGRREGVMAYHTALQQRLAAQSGE